MRVVLTAHIGTKYLFEGRLKSQINGKAHVSVAGLTEVVYALPPGSGACRRFRIKWSFIIQHKQVTSY